MEAKQVKDLMEAYASVYSQQSEQEVISEDLQQTVEKGLDAAAKNPVIQAIGKVITPVGRGRKTPTKESGGYRPVVKSVKEGVDTFDIVKCHLMSEGYADTEEAALAIMANMSEEWRQSILEEVDAQGNRSHDLFTGKPNPNYKPGNVKPKPQVKKEPPDREDGPLW